jgi:serine/threonine-protein kinase
MKSANFPQSEIAGYHLTGLLGSGGMGDVYKAFHPALNRTAAIKILHQKNLADRFKNEAYIQASVNHPNIARLYEYAVTGDIPCIIMEYAEGEPLDTYLHKKGRLSSEETERIVAQVASALAYLHAKDILHRDIKPSNFKIEQDGKVKMLDFGISKHKYTPKLTQEGFVVGTTEYMAPEQFKHHVEKKSDIWALGVMTYELLTGHLPFEANNPITLRSKISKASFTDPKILVPEISEKLSAVVEKSLRIHPSSRPTAAEIRTILTGKESLLPEKTVSPLRKYTPKLPLSIPRIRFPKIRLPEFSFADQPRFLLPGLIVLGSVIIFIILISIGSSNSGKTPATPPKTKAFPESAAKRTIKINVPGIKNAVLVFPDGKRRTAPYEITGNDGEHIKFKIQAEGYYEKDVEFNLGMGPYTYEFVLNKINN